MPSTYTLGLTQNMTVCWKSMLVPKVKDTVEVTATQIGRPVTKTHMGSPWLGEAQHMEDG